MYAYSMPASSKILVSRYITKLPLIVLILSLLLLLLQWLFYSVIITTKNSDLFQAVMHTKNENHHVESL